jgi:tetraacyldisaccharide 4'-kinase
MNKVENFFTNMWYNKSFISYLFLPLSFIYALVTYVRSFLFKLGVLKSYKCLKPVVVVGNISVGGNGKTPVVIAIVKYLQSKNLKVGVVSRGYKATPPSLPYEVSNSSTSNLCGDEPLLIFKKTNAYVVVDPIRSRACKYLENKVDVIITDDGLQHYALNRDIEIVVVDGKRRYGNGFYMPAGPLREGQSRLKNVDFIINNGGPTSANEYLMKLEPSDPYALTKFNDITLNKGCSVCAMAGIGDPSRFYKTVESLGYKVDSSISIGDHGLASIDDIKHNSKKQPLFITEKDMVKYDFSDCRNVYAVGIEANFSGEFLEKLYNSVKDLQQSKK